MSIRLSKQRLCYILTIGPNVVQYICTYQEAGMTIQTTYTQARANLAKLLDEVTGNREVVIIQRRRGDDVALISATELSSLMETAYLLRSPKNAERLLSALGRALKDFPAPQTVEELRREVGFDQEAA
jgi:antitoxin YefM